MTAKLSSGGPKGCANGCGVASLRMNERLGEKSADGEVLVDAHDGLGQERSDCDDFEAVAQGFAGKRNGVGDVDPGDG